MGTARNLDEFVQALRTNLALPWVNKREDGGMLRRSVLALLASTPALPAWAILWCWGTSALIPPRVRPWALLGISGAQVVVATLVPFLVITPAYTPTIISTSSLPKSVPELGWRFDNGVEWIGALVDQGGKSVVMIVRSGRRTPGTVTRQGSQGEWTNVQSPDLQKGDQAIGSVSSYLQQNNNRFGGPGGIPGFGGGAVRRPD